MDEKLILQADYIQLSLDDTIIRHDENLALQHDIEQGQHTTEHLFGLTLVNQHFPSPPPHETNSSSVRQTE